MNTDAHDCSRSAETLHSKARRKVLSYFGLKEDSLGDDGSFSCDIYLESARHRSHKSRFDIARLHISSDELDEEIAVAEKMLHSSSGMEVFSEKAHYECFADINSPTQARKLKRSVKRTGLSDGDVTYSIGASSLTYCLFCMLTYLDQGDENLDGRQLSRNALQMFVISPRLSYPRVEEKVFAACNGDWKEVLPRIIGLCSITVDFSNKSNISSARERATAFEFKYMYCTDAAIRRVADVDEFLFSRVLRTASSHQRLLDSPPRKKYDKEAVDYYRLALSSEDPYVRFLSFYHVLEHFFSQAYKRGVTQKLRGKLTAIDFSFEENCLFEIVKMIEKEAGGKQQAGYGNEKNELTFLLEEFIDISDLSSRLERDGAHWKDYYMTKKVVFEPNAPLVDWDSADAIKRIVNRIYKVRNAIIHSKQGKGGIYRPFLHEAELSKEIPLIRCVAERVIDGAGVLFNS